MSEEVVSLLNQAERCRRLARTIDNEKTRTALIKLAQEYEARAIRGQFRKWQSSPHPADVHNQPDDGGRRTSLADQMTDRRDVSPPPEQV
jgi:hypothetical protein